MTIRAFAAVTFVCLVGSVLGQDKDGLKPRAHPKRAIVSAAPVTQAEAAASFARLGGLYKSVLHVSVPSTYKAHSSSSPLARADVVQEFYRFYLLARPEFQVTMKSVPVDLPRLTFDKPSVKPAMVTLIERGCLAGYSNICTGKRTTLTPYEFGDAIGFFMARIAEMTHTSSTKWTPYLHKN